MHAGERLGLCDSQMTAHLFLLTWPGFPLAGIQQELECEPLKTTVFLRVSNLRFGELIGWC